MTEKQKKMLEELVMVLDAISQEAEDDQNFNECLAKMKVWNLSIDDMSSIIKDHIDQR